MTLTTRTGNLCALGWFCGRDHHDRLRLSSVQKTELHARELVRGAIFLLSSCSCSQICFWLCNACTVTTTTTSPSPPLTPPHHTTTPSPQPPPQYTFDGVPRPHRHWHALGRHPPIGPGGSHRVPKTHFLLSSCTYMHPSSSPCPVYFFKRRVRTVCFPLVRSFYCLREGTFSPCILSTRISAFSVELRERTQSQRSSNINIYNYYRNNSQVKGKSS